MKIKTLVAASALAAAGFVGVATQSASAACGVTMDAHNDDSNPATVNWDDSDVRIRTWIGWPLNYWQEGTWARVSTGSTTVPGNDTRSINETFTFNCNVQRQYRFEVSENGSTRWVYFPSVNSGGSSPTGWTTSIAPHFHL
jgi:hypothetical protein